MATVVWFKRDLRVSDHLPLAMAAAQPGPALGLFVLEPEWLVSPECSARHVAFLLESLAELRQTLAPRGLPLLVRVGPVVEVLAQLHQQGLLGQLLSHEETGPGWSYTRDIAVAAWCRAQGVPWQEVPQTGVVRRLQSRRGWAGRWQARMDAPLAETPAGWRGAVVDLPDLPDLSGLRRAGWAGAAGAKADQQPGGEAAAQAVLQSFLWQRGGNYRRAISSPLSAAQGCSRLSAHLAFGTISMRQVHQATEARIAAARQPDLAPGLASPSPWAHALRGFAGRLRWHCHFMQKLEDEPRIEFQNFSRAMDGLREGTFDRGHFEAWCAGRTGFPMVDACMRSLCATGWLNFRMRAMLVSFAAYHLWLHWREPGLFLARQFLDFEPGIHWSQMQMQSGTTGINTLRIYSPTKQALDHDPSGRFIRRWVPELAQVPLAHLATPWRMSPAEQQASGCLIGRDYPAPVVDEQMAARQAKERLYPLRATPEARAQADAIQQRHGSRKAGLPQQGRGTRKAKGTGTGTGKCAGALNTPSGRPVQGDLFGGDALQDELL